MDPRDEVIFIVRKGEKMPQRLLTTALKMVEEEILDMSHGFFYEKTEVPMQLQSA